MLPKYANLENDPNNFVQASKTIQKFNNQVVDKLTNDRTPPTTGMSPKNELEEFNSNLNEIDAFISQLKTYTNDSINKEFISSNKSVIQHNEELEQEGKLEPPQKIIDKQFFLNIIDKEASRIGVLPPLNEISLHQTGDYNRNEVMNYNALKGSKLKGGGRDEQETIRDEIEQTENQIQEIKNIVKKMMGLIKLHSTTENENDKERLENEITALQVEINSDGTHYPGFPIGESPERQFEYFSELINKHLETIKSLKDELKEDIKTTVGEITKPKQEEIDNLQLELDSIDTMSAEEYKKYKTKNKLGTNTKRETVKKKLEKQIQLLKEGLGIEISEDIEEIKDLDKLIQIIEEQKNLEKDEMVRQYDAMRNEIQQELQEQEERLLDLAKRKEELALRIQQITRARQAVKKLKDLEERKKENERLERERQEILKEEEARRKMEEEAIADAQKLQEELEKAEMAKQKELERLDKEALEEAKGLELQHKKAVGQLAESVPKVNPIIGTLTKLISLISKQNILFNGKIKKNINLLDRLNVEELISKLNKTISNLKKVNLNYIIISIDNGIGMLTSLISTLNKLSFDVSNSIQNYTSSVRGGSRFYNNHLQHFKFRGMASNPHPYQYML